MGSPWGIQTAISQMEESSSTSFWPQESCWRGTRDWLINIFSSHQVVSQIRLCVCVQGPDVVKILNEALSKASENLKTLDSLHQVNDTYINRL